MTEASIVRENLMTREGYSPYCGNFKCSAGMPRTQYTSGQFQCRCGWRSDFPRDFLDRYEERWRK